jgi:DHA2 family multidrug resistance protein
MPLTGFLVGRFGSKRLLLINIVGFMFTSALCGVSSNLTEIVTFRLLQGVFGASLVPLSQFIMRETFSAKEQPKMMAIWGIGVMAAPVMGPTLGGFITDALNWRWIFYINVPICIINFFLVLRFIKETPLRKVKIDWMGIILLIVSIGALQLFLDRGQVDDWFASSTITSLFIIFLVTFTLFIFHCLKIENPVVNLRLFADRTFGFGTLAMTLFSAAVLGSLTLLPQMLQTLFGYNSELSGITMAPRGVASAIMMAIASRLMMKGIDARWIISIGLAVGAYTTWIMGSITLDTDMDYIVALGFIQGLGIGCFFMPLSTIVYATLPKYAIAEASGLFSFGRNIGNAIGISLLTTYLSRDTQTNWNILGSHIKASSQNLHRWLSAQNLTLDDPHAISHLANELSTQASFIAYTHTFKVAAIILCGAIFMALLLKAPERGVKLAVDLH